MCIISIKLQKYLDIYTRFGYNRYKVKNGSPGRGQWQEGKSMKVKVRYTDDYRKYSKETLIAMLQDKDHLIERLQAELMAIKEQEELWRAHACKQEAASRAEEQEFYVLWMKSRKEGWSALLEKDLTSQQHAWIKKWRTEEAKDYHRRRYGIPPVMQEPDWCYSPCDYRSRG